MKVKIRAEVVILDKILNSKLACAIVHCLPILESQIRDSCKSSRWSDYVPPSFLQLHLCVFVALWCICWYYRSCAICKAWQLISRCVRRRRIDCDRIIIDPVQSGVYHSEAGTQVENMERKEKYRRTILQYKPVCVI